MEDLTGQRFTDRDTPGMGGCYGNDACLIEENSFSFGAWLAPDLIRVAWTGSYDYAPIRRLPREAFTFEGPVRFRGVIMKVKDEADAKPCFAAMFPHLAPSELILTKGREFNHGRGMPAYRRRWTTMVWTRPGATPAKEDLC
jgi:hypothetical protein